jgi:hypothetical protein
MQPFHPNVLALYRAQFGVASEEQLAELGLTRHQIAYLVSSKQLSIEHHGVYRLAAFDSTFESQCLAATLADDEVAISHQSAGRLLGLREMQTARLHVTVSHHRHPFASGNVKVHRSMIVDDHWRKRPDGIRTTSPARTLFDLAGSMSDLRLESVLEHALRLDVVTLPELWAVARTMASRGRAGSGRFVRLLNSRPAWLKPVDSKLELVVADALTAIGLPTPVRQHALRLSSAVTIHPDLAWPDLRWAIEVDHVTWHGGAVATMNDHARDRQLRLIGWEVERITDREVKDRLPAVTRDLSRLFRLRQKSCRAA